MFDSLLISMAGEAELLHLAPTLSAGMSRRYPFLAVTFRVRRSHRNEAESARPRRDLHRKRRSFFCLPNR
jgi:hypothetical protein